MIIEGLGEYCTTVNLGSPSIAFHEPSHMMMLERLHIGAGSCLSFTNNTHTGYISLSSLPRWLLVSTVFGHDTATE